MNCGRLLTIEAISSGVGSLSMSAPEKLLGLTSVPGDVRVPERSGHTADGLSTVCSLLHRCLGRLSGDAAV